MAVSLTLDQLVRELCDMNNKLKENTAPSTFWPGGELGDSISCLETKAVFERTFKSLQLLKDLYIVLDLFQLTVGHKIRQIRHTIIPPSRHHGLSSLPDELFLHIIRLVCSDVEMAKARGVYVDRLGHARVVAGQRIKQLSSVSRRFRAAAISTGFLWSFLDSRDCLSDRFETRLARSKNVPISLDLDLTTRSEWEEILSRTLPFKDRWLNLVAGLSLNLNNVLKLFPSVEFPRLEGAFLQFSVADDHDAFFCAWKFPSIKILRLRDAIPRPGLFCDLTTFKFTAWEPSDGFDAIQPRLWDFLGQTHNLQILGLDFSGFANPSPRTFTSLELKSVKTLSIINYFRRRDENPFSAVTLGNIIKSLRIPNRRKVEIGVYFQAEEDLNDWLSSISLDSDLCQKVWKLALSTAFRLSEEYMVSFFASFPNVEELEVDAAQFGSTLEHSDCQLNLNRLETLSLPRIRQNTSWRWEHQLLETFTSYHAVHLIFFDGLRGELLDADDVKANPPMDSPYNKG